MRYSWLVTLLFLATVTFAEAQQTKVYSVGVLALASPEIHEIQGLRDGLKESGYVEGKNLTLDKAVKQTYEELRSISKSYVERKFDVIVAIGASAPLIAIESTKQIPIVFVGVFDPVQSGLVRSVARPEGNVTGVTRATDLELQGKRLEIFKEAVPFMRRVTVLYNARGENPAHVKSLTLLQKVAPDLGLKLEDKPIKSSADIERVLSLVSKDTTDGIFLICATFFRNSYKKLGTVAIQKKLALSGCGVRTWPKTKHCLPMELIVIA